MAGGTWMALGPHGVVAAILNRPGSLGPLPDKRSRGGLPLVAAQFNSAHDAVESLRRLDAGLWRPFNMVVADRQDAFFLRAVGSGHPHIAPLPEGIAMVTAHDPNDLASPRIRRHLPRFQDVPAPDPALGDWAGWEALLADDGHGPAGVTEAMRVPPIQGFGTVCASLLALGAAGERRWRFCPGPAGTAPFSDIELAPA
jgi:hypothetical protein